VRNVPKLNWATRLTLLRISLTPLLAVFLYYNRYDFALLVFVTASLTDAADGFIARIYDQKTWLGTFLDPAADKLIIITSFLFLTFRKTTPLRIPEWVTIIIAFRDAIIVVGATLTLLLINEWEVKPSILGKLNTVFQFLTILFATVANFLIMREIRYFDYHIVLYLFSYITLALTILSGILYLRSGSHTLLHHK